MSSEELSDKAYAMIGQAAFGDRMMAIAILEEIGTNTDACGMFGVCVGIAEAVRIVLGNAHGPLVHGAQVALVMPPGAERQEPEKTFAARFITAWLNGDRDMCRALFFATFQAPGVFGHADNVVALVDVCGRMIRDAHKAMDARGQR